MCVCVGVHLERKVRSSGSGFRAWDSGPRVSALGGLEYNFRGPTEFLVALVISIVECTFQRATLIEKLNPKPLNPEPQP